MGDTLHSFSDAQVRWVNDVFGAGIALAPAPDPAQAQGGAASAGGGGPPAPAAGGMDPQVDAALGELETVVQGLVPLGVPAKAAEGRIAAYRARAAKGGAKASPALLKDIGADRDRLAKQGSLIREITGIAADLESQAKTLEADGLPSAPLDLTVSQVRDAIPKAAAGGLGPLGELRKIALHKRDALKADADKQRHAQTGGEDGALHDLRETAAAQIGKIADKDKQKPLSDKLDALDGLIGAVGKAKDAAAQATARDAADAAARALLGETAKAGPDAKAARKEVQAAFKKAVADKYGISAEDGSDGHIDFEKFYETLEKMPVGHVAHANMKSIGYKQKLRSGDHGIGLFTGSGIQLGDMGDEETDNYRDPTRPGEKPKVPRFAITVLHELGHGVDTRWGIMKGGAAAKESCGAWHQYGGIGDLASELAANHLREAGKTGGSAASLSAAIVTAINTGKAARPEDTDEAAWPALQKFLGRCAKLTKEDFGDRNYSFGSDGQWYSYSAKVRRATQVTAYQWTAPAEWFAELYAMTWYLQREPPGSVDEKVKAYLYRKGAEGGAGAPAAQKAH